MKEKIFLYKAVKHEAKKYFADHGMKLYQLWAVVNKRQIGEDAIDYISIDLSKWWRDTCIEDYNRDVLGIETL